MSTTAAAETGFSREVWEAFVERRGEPDWLAARRRTAFEAYENLLERPLDAEEFKRVDLRAFRPGQYRLAAAEAAGGTAAGSISTLMQGRAEFGGAVIHLDGSAVQSSLAPELAKKGVLFGDLAEDERFTRPYLWALESLRARGARATLEALAR